MGECAAEAVGQRTEAPLMCIEWFSGGDEREGRTEEIHPLKREKLGADLRKVEKLLLSHNKGRKAMEMGGWESGKGR